MTSLQAPSRRRRPIVGPPTEPLRVLSGEAVPLRLSRRGLRAGRLRRRPLSLPPALQGRVRLHRARLPSRSAGPVGAGHRYRATRGQLPAVARAPRIYKPGRPRRIARVRRGLLIRRERTPDGWTLRFTGPEASGPLMEDIMDYVEQTFGRE